jgi:hypothetical protein
MLGMTQDERILLQLRINVTLVSLKMEANAMQFLHLLALQGGV